MLGKQIVVKDIEVSDTNLENASTNRSKHLCFSNCISTSDGNLHEESRQLSVAPHSGRYVTTKEALITVITASGRIIRIKLYFQSQLLHYGMFYRAHQDRVLCTCENGPEIQTPHIV
jgi:hypothetical protein